MTTTATFAILIGLMSIAAGIGGFMRPDEWRRMFDEFEASPGLMLSVAFIAILFGSVVILLHPLWDTWLQILVSIMGWLSFIEGLALLSVPHAYIGLIKPLVGYARAWAIFSLLLGVLLLGAGLAAQSAAATLY
jgi:hypothetical protein